VVRDSPATTTSRRSRIVKRPREATQCPVLSGVGDQQASHRAIVAMRQVSPQPIPMHRCRSAATASAEDWPARPCADSDDTSG
jgi:hypothetical protein